MRREQFTWYRSYYEALKTLPAKDFKQAVLAVCAYALDEDEPELTGVPNSVFTLIRPTLDSGRNKAANRQNKTKTKQEQNDNKQEQMRKEKEGEREKEREKENDSSLSPTPLSPFRAPCFEEVCEYNRVRGKLIDPKPFFDYYDAAGWRDSEGKPVYNWQQKFIAWELRELDKRKGDRHGRENDAGGGTGKDWDIPGELRL